MLAPPRSASKFAKNISNLDKIVARGVFLPKRVTDIKKEEGIIVVEVDQAKGSERNPFEHPVFVPTQSPLRRAFTVDGEDNRSSPSPFRLDLKGLESIELSFGDSFMKVGPCIRSDITHLDAGCF
ncbi:hypothetical protein HK101_005681 [Irineochytrium annulatum]|nr:hypothetical protein HK101_005681 [Irineochytrium annulatum]